MKLINNKLPQLIILLIILSIVAGQSCTNSKSSINKSPTKPNIILIVADDLGYSDLSCYGSPLIETPNLDKLAQSGIRYTNGYAAAPLCSPTRASIVTGLNPARINLTEHIHGHHPTPPTQRLITPKTAQALDTNLVTIPEVLSEVGYTTKHIGKWHLGGRKASPQYQGYDSAFAGSWAGLPGSFFYPFFNGGAYPELKDAAEEGDYLTDILTDEALRYIEQNKDTTFFLALNFYAPHVPIEGKDSLVNYYKQKADRLGVSMPNPHYAAMVTCIDENIGRIMQKVVTLENTLIIFTSDNGGLDVEEVPAFAKHTPPTTNAPLRAGKGYIYEGGIREPFIARWTEAIPPGQVSEQIVSTTDLLNTFASVSGAAYRSPDGRDMSTTWTDQTGGRTEFIMHFPHYSPQRGKPGAVVRQEQYKLIHWYENDRYELYDLDADPGESTDIANENVAIVDRLKERLVQWKKTIGAIEATPNPEYVEAN